MIAWKSRSHHVRVMISSLLSSLLLLSIAGRSDGFSLQHRSFIFQSKPSPSWSSIAASAVTSTTTTTINVDPSLLSNDGVSDEQINGNSNNSRDAPQPTSTEDSTIKKSTSTTNKKAGIILNLNARQVIPEMETIANDVFRGDGDGCDDDVESNKNMRNVFCTTDAVEARDAARHMAQHLDDYSVLIPVGGDGTLCSFLQTLCEAIQDVDPSVSCIEQAMAKLPPIGYIPLGTGNGMGSVVGCTDNEQQQNPRGRRLLKGIFRRKRAKLDTFEATLRRLASYSQATTSMTNNDMSDVFDDLVEIPMIQVSRRSTAAAKVGKKNNTGQQTPSPVNNNNNNKSDLCFFAGIGFDSLMLNDFSIIKSWAAESRATPGFVKRWLGSVAGYCVALVVRTLPQCVANNAHRIRVKVTVPSTAESDHDDVLWIDHRRGDIMRRCNKRNNNNDNNKKQESTDAPGAPRTNGSGSTNGENTSDNDDDDDSSLLLYEGTTGILAAGTCPYYGGGLKLFPFAGLAASSPAMHLRLGRIHPLTGFLNIPRIFGGTYRDASPQRFGCLDFIGKEFRVQVLEEGEGKEAANASAAATSSSGFPLQHSGDSLGNVNEFRLKVLSEPVRFVSFLPPRVIIDE